MANGSRLARVSAEFDAMLRYEASKKNVSMIEYTRWLAEKTIPHQKIKPRENYRLF